MINKEALQKAWIFWNGIAPHGVPPDGDYKKAIEATIIIYKAMEFVEKSDEKYPKITTYNPSILHPTER